MDDDLLGLRQLPRPLRQFLHTESGGGIALLVAAVVALVWANSPWSGGYESLWSTELRLSLGGVELSEDLRHWVNDGLMAIFFFVVGLEIKRELVVGELRAPRTAALPALAALGGMVVPAALYLAVNAGREGVDGWGIPMATDIAFAVGVVALLGSRVPSALKLFLLTLAIVDDIGAILVIALVYSDGVDAGALAVAALAGVGVVVLRRLGVDWPLAYVAAGIVLWVATYQSGVHATIAGVVLGLLTPARPVAPDLLTQDWVSDLAEDPSPQDLATLRRVARSSVSPAERLQHDLHPLTSFVIVPLFALANAGVVIERGAFDAPGAGAVALGIGAGLVAGKVIGITGATWLAVRTGVGRLPSGVTVRHLVGVAGVAGIGFTVSLFIAGLAFPEAPGLEAAAKIGILIASVVAAVVGSAILLTAPPTEA
ncbi:MAG TPA: Na+/H+ antiporter NhaA [Acidimicrobiales bacterium]|nr:Na+/H+ antiporter NhaA [Acidimicrobiales bacterium]